MKKVVGRRFLDNHLLSYETVGPPGVIMKGLNTGSL